MLNVTIVEHKRKLQEIALQCIYEPGDFTVFVGGSSADIKEASFSVEK